MRIESAIKSLKAHSRNIKFQLALASGSLFLYAKMMQGTVVDSNTLMDNPTFLNYLSGIAARTLGALLPGKFGKLAPYALMFVDTDMYKDGYNIEVDKIEFDYSNNQNQKIGENRSTHITVDYNGSGNLSDILTNREILNGNLEGVLNPSKDVLNPELEKIVEFPAEETLRGYNYQNFVFHDFVIVTGVGENRHASIIGTIIGKDNVIKYNDGYGLDQTTIDYEEIKPTIKNSVSDYTEKVNEFEKHSRLFLLGELGVRGVIDGLKYKFRNKRGKSKIPENAEELLYPKFNNFGSS